MPRNGYGLFGRRTRTILTTIIDAIRKEARTDKTLEIGIKRIESGLARIKSNNPSKIDMTSGFVKAWMKMYTPFSNVFGGYGFGIFRRTCQTVSRLVGTILDERDSMQYGGFVSSKERSLQYHDLRSKFPPTMEKALVVQKLRWKDRWHEFLKENSLSRKIWALGHWYRESTNITVMMMRLMTGTILGIFLPVVKETETARVLGQVMEMDSGFRVDRFMREIGEVMIPEILEARMVGDRNRLRKWCSEGVMMQIEMVLSEREKQGLYSCGKVLDMRHLEFVGARNLDGEPLLIVSFVTQETECIQNREGKIVRGGEDQIQTVEHVWGMCRDMEEHGKWRLKEMVDRRG